MIKQVVIDPSQPSCVRIEETQVIPKPGEGEVLVKLTHVAIHGQVPSSGCPSVGVVVEANGTSTLAVGDFVYASAAPLQSLFPAHETTLYRIDPTFDHPAVYLSALSPLCVGVYDSLLTHGLPPNGVIAIYKPTTLAGRILTPIVGALASTLNCTVIEFYDAADVHPMSVDVCVDCGDGVRTSALVPLLRSRGLLLLVEESSSSFVLSEEIVRKGITIKGICSSYNAYPHASYRLRRLRQMLPGLHFDKYIPYLQGFEQVPRALTPEGAIVTVSSDAVFPAQAALPEQYAELTSLMEQLEEAEQMATTTQNPNLRGFLQIQAHSIKREISKRDIVVPIPIANPNPNPTPNPDAEPEPVDAEAAAKSEPVPMQDEVPAPVTAAPVPVQPVGALYQSIDTFAWDQGSYNSPTVTVYVSLDGVGSVKQSVICNFQKDSFDLKVHGLNGRNYRLFKDNLEKDIIPSQSKFIVKANKVVIKLTKVKGEYSYEHWSNLTAKKGRKQGAPDTQSKADPMGGLMDMMKDMYEDGDDNTKKIIGEAMMKARTGEKAGPPSMDDL